MPRQFLVGGNWKMNGTPALVCEIANALNNLKINVEVVVAPPFPLLLHMRHNLTSGMHVAAQNCGDVLNGAHTGETSATLLKELGVNWVILGHSERREIYKESDSTVAKKVKLAVNCGLTIIACIGEKLNERESGQTFDVIFRQLLAIKNELNENDWKNIVIAYEPVWAIGTGKVATPTQAQEVHEQIRTWLTQNVSETVSSETRILYGGSVSGKNCQELSKKNDIDGFLVGGASLKCDDFSLICSCKL